MPSTPEVYFRSARKLIGRKSELDTVVAALNGAARSAQALLLEGQGGIGKTRLLSEARELCLEREGVLCTQVIDLYLTRYHQPARIMYAIAEQLQRDADRRGVAASLHEGFAAALESFYSSLGEGSEDQRHQLERAFLAHYSALATRQRLVLLIDTLEKLHPVIPDAQQFDFREVGRLESWLANLVARLPNTVVILAGRPRPRQRELFARAFGDRLTVLGVEPFTPEETRDYIRTEFAGLVELGDEQIDVLHTISAGRPVVLAIALACAERQIIDIMALPAEFEQRYPDNAEQLSDAFVRLVVSDLHTQRLDLAQMLARAVYLRKGLRVPLLNHVVADEGMLVEPHELRAQIGELTSFVFVKPIDDGEIILHDEMYELLLGKIGDQQAGHWWRATIEYLDRQITATMAELQSPASHDGDAPRSGYVRLQQKLQTLQVERMFYQMSLDLRRGYQSYRELGSNAIAARDDDFDAQLQEELARFFDPDTAWGRLYHKRLLTSGLTWDQIVYDEGIRWVYRRINAHLPGRDRYSEAIALAERVRERYRSIYDQSLLARCDLDAAQLQAEVYIPAKAPRGAQIAQNYERLVAELTATIAAMPSGDPDAAYANFILANACNYWGYYERVNERLQSAAEKYKAAVRIYRDLGPEVDSLRAVTLNNLGYAVARQGESQRGLRYLAQSLELVERTGAVYRIASTVNTQAHLYADLGQMEKALRSVLEARRLFAQFDSVRAVALNANAEGRIRGRIAESTPDPRERADEYARAAAAYRLAIASFDQEGELARQIEVRSSLAKLLRDWGSARGNGGGEAERAEALSLLAQARALTGTKTSRVMRCSILEAMASINVDRGRYAEALALLDEAVALLPPSLQRADSFEESPETSELRLYWLRFAQIELQYALAAFGQGRREEACAHLLRAFTGLITFSPDASPIERFRGFARRALFAIDDSAAIEALRAPTRAASERLRIPAAALNIVEHLLTQVSQDIEDRDLLGS
ncbi:MAG: ATP-binding protein [Chloroflexales bacterium]|nr:ATP-binding protein [Chloroflexales bacterium]